MYGHSEEHFLACFPPCQKFKMKYLTITPKKKKKKLVAEAYEFSRFSVSCQQGVNWGNKCCYILMFIACRKSGGCSDPGGVVTLKGVFLEA